MDQWSGLKARRERRDALVPCSIARRPTGRLLLQESDISTGLARFSQRRRMAQTDRPDWHCARSSPILLSTQAIWWLNSVTRSQMAGTFQLLELMFVGANAMLPICNVGGKVIDAAI